MFLTPTGILYFSLSERDGLTHIIAEMQLASSTSRVFWLRKGHVHIS